MEKGRNLIIAGSGSAGGGEFDAVKISGKGQVHGDVACDVFKTNGASDIFGNVQAKTMTVNGASKLEGNLEVGEWKIQGSADVKGKVSGEVIKVEGFVKIEGDCEAENFTGKCHFTIGGMLNAGFIDIDLYGACSVKEIGGETIRIQKEMSFIRLKEMIKSMFNYSDKLTVDTVEGDDIYLEYTKAKVVRGNHVKLGTGCEVELVEYKESFEQDKDAKVKQSEKVGS